MHALEHTRTHRGAHTNSHPCIQVVFSPRRTAPLWMLPAVPPEHCRHMRWSVRPAWCRGGHDGAPRRARGVEPSPKKTQRRASHRAMGKDESQKRKEKRASHRTRLDGFPLIKTAVFGQRRQRAPISRGVEARTCLRLSPTKGQEDSASSLVTLSTCCAQSTKTHWRMSALAQRKESCPGGGRERD